MRLVAIGILALCAMVLFFSTYYTVGQFERGVLTRFGRLVEVTEPGLHFKMPLVNSVKLYRTDILSLSPAQREGVSTYTVDNQEVHVVFTVQYRTRPDKIAFIYENVQDLEARLAQIAEDRLKAELGKVNTSHVAEQRGTIRDGIKRVLQAATESLGVEVTDFQLNNITYDPTFATAVKAAAAARATVETREQERQQAEKSALTAQIKAQGEANGVKAKADGDAYALLANARAQADALRVQNAALRESKDVLELRRIEVERAKAERWNGALPTAIYSGAPIPFMKAN